MSTKRQQEREPELKTPNAPATPHQTWKLFTLTKKDHRELGLTMKQASTLIKYYIAEDEAKKKAKRAAEKAEALEIIRLLGKTSKPKRAAVKADVTAEAMEILKLLNSTKTGKPIRAGKNKNGKKAAVAA